MLKYRILERRTNGDWTPFGVAYERNGRTVLFAPPWRADRILDAASLEELDQRHCPSAEFRWRAVETTTGLVSHPIDLLQRALALEAVTEPQSVGAAAGIVAAIRDLLTGGPSPGLALARGAGLAGGATTERGELPTLEEIARELPNLFQNDPDLLAAFVNLRAALSDPQMRPTVLEALEAFARAARSQTEERGGDESISEGYLLIEAPTHKCPDLLLHRWGTLPCTMIGPP